MNTKERLIIPYRGLKDGSHSFSFSIDEKFFEALEYAEIKRGNLSVNLIIEKKLQDALLKFKIEGKVEVKCDRCLDDLELNIKFKNDVFFKPEEQKDETSEESIQYKFEDDTIDITHYVYESIVLSLPYQKVHKKKADCNKEMVTRLKIYSGKKENEIDSRWEKLK